MCVQINETNPNNFVVLLVIFLHNVTLFLVYNFDFAFTLIINAEWSI